MRSDLHVSYTSVRLLPLTIPAKRILVICYVSQINDQKKNQSIFF